MAISEKQRQKKLEKKAKKKKQYLTKRNKEGVGITLSKRKAASYSSCPLHECLIPDGLFKIGIGNVLFSRKAGPKETPALAKKIVNHLHEHCGEGGAKILLIFKRYLLPPQKIWTNR